MFPYHQKSEILSFCHATVHQWLWSYDPGVHWHLRKMLDMWTSLFVEILWRHSHVSQYWKQLDLYHRWMGEWASYLFVFLLLYFSQWPVDIWTWDLLWTTFNTSVLPTILIPFHSNTLHGHMCHLWTFFGRYNLLATFSCYWTLLSSCHLLLVFGIVPQDIVGCYHPLTTFSFAYLTLHMTTLYIIAFILAKPHCSLIFASPSLSCLQN